MPTRPAPQGGALVLVQSQQAAWTPAESGTEVAIALESKTRTEPPLTDLVRPAAAEDDFRGQAFATVRTKRTYASKIACRGANGQARPHSLQSEVGLEACRS